MKTSEYIAASLNSLPTGYVFTYADFVTAVNHKEAIIKTLNRMLASGKIVKLAKGKIYKPESSAFGKLPPRQNQIAIVFLLPCRIGISGIFIQRRVVDGGLRSRSRSLNFLF